MQGGERRHPTVLCLSLVDHGSILWETDRTGSLGGHRFDFRVPTELIANIIAEESPSCDGFLRYESRKLGK